VAQNGSAQDGASFFFDLKLMLPAGMTAPDIQRARQTVEHRLLRILRKKDRVVWSGDGFFLVIATSHPARAGAAAERIHEDICAVLAGVRQNSSSRTSVKPDAQRRGDTYGPDPKRSGSTYPPASPRPG
jgi:hypothetical protein